MSHLNEGDKVQLKEGGYRGHFEVVSPTNIIFSNEEKKAKLVALVRPVEEKSFLASFFDGERPEGITELNITAESDALEPARTAFSRWSEAGEPDPHGYFYQGSVSALGYGDMASEIVATALVTLSEDFTRAAWLTAGKERLRWLSRKVYNSTQNHDELNLKRATLPLGHMTDDELANYFYLKESEEGLKAGRERMLWLIQELKNNYS